MSSSEASEVADFASVKATVHRVTSLVSDFSMAFGLTLIAIETVVCSTQWSLSAPLVTSLFLMGIFCFVFGLAVRRVVIQEKKLLPDDFRQCLLSSVCSTTNPSEMSCHVSNFKDLLIVSGILVTILGVITIYGDVMYPETVAVIDFGLGIMDVFTGLACSFILAGVSTIIAACKLSKCLILLSMILNMLSMCTSITLEVFICQEYFYLSRDIALATSSIQVLVIMAKLAPPFTLVFLSMANTWAMIFALIRVRGRSDNTPMPKYLSLRPCTRIVLTMSGFGLILSGMALTSSTVALPAIGHFDYWNNVQHILLVGLSVAGMSLCTGIAALALTRARRSMSSTGLLVFLLGIITVGVSIYSMVQTVELYNYQMYNQFIVQKEGIREVNGTIQFCVCHQRTKNDSLDACIDVSKLCDGVVDMPATHYRFCPVSLAGPYYNDYGAEERVAPDESYCFESWTPLFAAQFGFVTMSAVLAAIAAVLNLGCLLKTSAEKALKGAEDMSREMHREKMEKDDKEEILKDVYWVNV